jgi:F-box protein 21
MPQLPLDLYIAILHNLPAHRLECDGGVPALVSCLQANSLLREAALVPSLWEPHYRARYLHSENPDKSAVPNWRLMYVERRRQDNMALDLLDGMVSRREGRYQRAAALTALSFNLWDVLDIQCSLPVPPLFSQDENATTAAAAPYALTRRYWASKMAEAISRRFAILQWGRLARETENSVSFVDAFSTLSCFFGKPPREVRFSFSVGTSRLEPNAR